MKRTAGLLIRLLLSLTLLLASWPAGASEPAKVPVAKPACAMPCCQGPKPAMAHCLEAPAPAEARLQACGCEITPTLPATVERTPIKFSEAAVLSEAFLLSPAVHRFVETTFVAGPVGTKPENLHALPPGRAPPVV